MMCGMWPGQRRQAGRDAAGSPGGRGQGEGERAEQGQVPVPGGPDRGHHGRGGEYRGDGLVLPADLSCFAVGPLAGATRWLVLYARRLCAASRMMSA
jgi:hypothetical protein